MSGFARLTGVNEAKVIQVIEIKSLAGEGTAEYPYYEVTEYYSLDGQLLARHNPLKPDLGLGIDVVEPDTTLYRTGTSGTVPSDTSVGDVGKTPAVLGGIPVRRTGTVAGECEWYKDAAGSHYHSDTPIQNKEGEPHGTLEDAPKDMFPSKATQIEDASARDVERGGSEVEDE